MIHPSKIHSRHTNMVPSPAGPLENAPHHRPMIRSLQRQELVDRVRLLLLRQKRAYNRRLKILQQQSQEHRPAQNSELLENHQQLRLTMDLPGVHPSDVQVQIDTSSRILSISAKRLFLSLDDVTCRRTQVLCQQYRVQSNVILQVKATLQNGVLTITAPKAPLSSKEEHQESDAEVSIIPSSSDDKVKDPVVSVPISYL
jgi:HSP20 family molecular chaperone IbpA